MSLELWSKRYRAPEVPRVDREVVSVSPDEPVEGAAPVLCVTGDPRGAAAFGEHWLGHIAGRGRSAHAVSVRGQGGTAKAGGGRAGQVHDLVQTAAALPRQCVLIGHDKGAGLVAHAMTRYPVAAAVLLAPRGLTSAPGAAVGEPRVLVAGSPDDRRSGQKTLDKVAEVYGGAPLLFPGVGHDFMSDPGWQAPLAAILDWLDDPSHTV